MTPSRLGSRLLGLAAGVASIAFVADASAYCRTAGCESGVGAQCTPSQAGDCGVTLAWPSPCISYSLQEDGTSLASFDTVRTQIRQAFDAWQNASCGEGPPGLALVETDTVACRKRDFDQDGGTNANLIVFRDDDWPYGSRGVLALTTVTYGLETGTIRDADMEINSEGVDLSFGDSGVTYDFLSVVTHEAGHFLGLAHSPVGDATMRRDYQRGTTELRTLDADDVAAICAVYPSAELDACNPLPEGGLRGSCGDDDGATGDDEDGSTGEGCAVSPRTSWSGAAWVAGAAVLFAARLRRRARASRA